jgi:DNA mismatch repair ATPase MutS
LDVSIFVSGTVASLYLQDAVTAAGILEIDPSEWRTEDGYPALQFDSEKIGEYSQRLTACGYAVRILEPAEHSQRSPGSAARAVIINIASARRGRNIL